MDEKYPREKRGEVKRLNISNKNLRGEFSLEGFINISRFDCSSNRLNNLNFLSTLANPEKLLFLDVSNNLFSSDLYCFSSFANLRKLTIGNNKKWVWEGDRFFGNHFFGSLEPLRKLDKLSFLDINGTDIDRGLEHLSETVETIHCETSYKSDAKVKEIWNILKFYQFDLQNWRKNGKPSKKELERNQQIEKQIKQKMEELERKFKTNFSLELQERWKKKGFSLMRAQEWVDIGLTPNEVNFACWLVKEKKYTPWWISNYGKIEELREEYINGDDYLGFLLRKIQKIETENKNDSIEENQKIIQTNFSTKLVKKWLKRGFAFSQIKEWIDFGFQITDVKICYIIRSKRDYRLSLNDRISHRLTSSHEERSYIKESLKFGNIEELKERYDTDSSSDDENREEIKSAQTWFEKNYPKEKRDEIEMLDIDDWKLKGSLHLENFGNLKRIYCGNSDVDELKITNCPRIEELYVKGNQLTNLDFLNSLNPEKLTHLCISGNEEYLENSKSNFPPQDLSIFSKFRNLKELYLADYLFYGSLKHLKNLTKLERLDVSENASEGLEYLPDNLEKINLTYWKYSKDLEELEPYVIAKKKQAARKSAPLLASCYSHDSYDFQTWKEDKPYYKWLVRNLKKINPSLNIRVLFKQKNIFFNVKNGSFNGDLNSLLFFLEINQGETYFLKKTITELIILIKKQNSKINDKLKKAYTYFAPEKELIIKLLETHNQYFQAKKQGLECDELFELFYESRKVLKDKIGKELMEEAEKVLNDCEELIKLNLELESKTNIQLSVKLDREGKTSITYNNITVGQICGDYVTGNKTIAYHENVHKRARRDSWEESSTTRNKVEKLELMETDNQEIQSQIQKSLLNKNNY